MDETANTLDERGLELLFRSHFDGLCRFAVDYVKDPEAAREIVQEVFVGLWERRATIDLSRPVKSYLSTSVRNRCLNHLRDHRKFSGGLLELEELAGADGYEPHDRLSEADLHGRITSAIGELPERCREVFTLSRHSNLRYQDIAEQLGISVKTVETQMSKALNHMRIRLAEFLVAALLFVVLPQHPDAVAGPVQKDKALFPAPDTPILSTEVRVTPLSRVV